MSYYSNDELEDLKRENAELKDELEDMRRNCNHDWYILRSSYDNRAPYDTYKCSICGKVIDESISC